MGLLWILFMEYHVHLSKGQHWFPCMSFGYRTFIFASEHAACCLLFTQHLVFSRFSCKILTVLSKKIFCFRWFFVAQFFHTSYKFLHNHLHNYMIKYTCIYHPLCLHGIFCNDLSPVFGENWSSVVGSRTFHVNTKNEQ